MDFLECREEDPLYEGCLSGSAHAGNHREDVQWDLNIYIFQVVLPCPFDFDKLQPFPSFRRQFDVTDMVQVLTCQAFGIGVQGAEITLENNLASIVACKRADVDDLVGRPDDLLIMLNNDDRVPEIT